MDSTTIQAGAALPEVPESLRSREVALWREPVELDSYEPAAPEQLPAFLNRRVYQGSSGRVYPLPFIDRIATEPIRRRFDAVHLVNRWVRLMVLPELGGRIHVAVDRTTGHDFFYRNQVIKPALVGLAGPWMAGGVEFNWPQHHRPATWLPCDVDLVDNPDGSATVWCSDHDPLQRMKGMHGLTLHPDRSVVELTARLHNRTDLTQTFLWWANVAARAGADHQSFFPPDVGMVADHAKRAVVGFPAADRPYYGIDYPARADDSFSSGGTEWGGDRIDFYRNIPVPTSYMCLGSTGSFFGGYDHAVRAGFVHVADRHISVGKKQWTWGNAPFGWAWDDNLSDDGSAYVELMAGVFTDNQPDFSFIAPGETKVFSQHWFPISGIGAPQCASVHAAMRMELEGTRLRLHLLPTADHAAVAIEVQHGKDRLTTDATLTTNTPLTVEVPLKRSTTLDELIITLTTTEPHGPVELLRWEQASSAPTRDAAVEPMAPSMINSVDELYRTGVHLEQNRHATRSPEPYWIEALERDPGHADSATALGIRALRQGRYDDARTLLSTAVDRLTALNANPADTTALYHLGLVLLRMDDEAGAENAFGRALWTRQWRAPAGWQLALIAIRRDALAEAEGRLTDVLRCEPDHLQARAAMVWLLQRQGRDDEARRLGRETLIMDPLEWWTRDLLGERLGCDEQTCLDVALEYRRLGDHDAVRRVLHTARAAATPYGSPRAGAVIALLLGESPRAGGDWEFPDRLDEYDVLRTADPDNPVVNALLGTWLYAHDRSADAIDCWRTAVAADPNDWVSWRNLGLAQHNDAGDARAAHHSYARALAVMPDQPRLRYEADQLAARLGRPISERLRALSTDGEPLDRDDAVITWAHLSLSLGGIEQVRQVLSSRHFQPWEGGEGEALRAWDRTHLLLARSALADHDHQRALTCARAALDPPATLGEQRHPLANTAELHLCLGDALAAAGQQAEARQEWELAAAEAGDFLDMASAPFSEATGATLQALTRLERHDEADALATAFEHWLAEWEQSPATIDFFATSLPSMLLFAEDVGEERRRRVEVMRAQLQLHRGESRAARTRLTAVLTERPDHGLAGDLLATLTDQERPKATDHKGVDR
ncbi:DUF5107 domain-containing protein [Propionibacteriaceae bacterium Y1700]|uniref:DUF5107 domain-containing protein n=1 Tax=Microlunatus sp. Y1700 TaxID=3418487 RepID=UPI003DA6DAD2